jgi:hypothetical protein
MQDEVKSSSPAVRFLIARHSPDRSLEVGLHYGPCVEKTVVDARCSRGSPFSEVRLVEQKSRKMGIIRAFLGNYRAGILCSPDCVAEREGFEPSVQVLARTTV